MEEASLKLLKGTKTPQNYRKIPFAVLFSSLPFPAHPQQTVRFLPMISSRQLYLHIVGYLGNLEHSYKNYSNVERVCMWRKNIILLDTELKSKTREEMISGGV